MICTWYCANIKFPVMMMCYAYVRYHLGKLDKEYAGTTLILLQFIMNLSYEMKSWFFKVID